MPVELELHTGSADDNLPVGSPIRENYQQEVGALDESAQMDKLASHISEQWTINKDDRVRIEQEMMRLQEAVNSEYDPNTMKAIRGQGGSEIFIPLTSMQCNAGASWLLSVLNPPGDKAFSFKPTPVPSLPETVKSRIKDTVMSTLEQKAPRDQAGAIAGPNGSPIKQSTVQNITDDEEVKTLKAFNRESVIRAERMESKVNDQLEQSGWFDTLEAFVADLVTFPTAFIKTTYETRVTMAVTNYDGQISMEKKEELVAVDERVSPFDMYPSPDQTDMHDGSPIERLRLSRSKVYACLDKPGYSNENVLKVLAEADGSGFAAWQSNVDSTRRYSENHSTDFSGQDGSIYGLRFMGPVSVDKLIDWGYKIEDLQAQGFVTEELDEYGQPSSRDLYREIDIDAILIGNHVIKATPNQDPQGKRQYYAASYRKVPGSFWGKSVAMLAQPHQRMVNATSRALSNNMGIASGPQIIVYIDRLPNGEELQEIVPLKQWQVLSDPTGSNQKPIDFFQPASNAEELVRVYQFFFDSVGDVTGIPKAAYATDPSRSAQGAQTASGLAMLLETASKQIKQAVRNIDTGVIEPRLRYQYRTNMMDPDIPNAYKGDMAIVATGAKSIVAKAVENQRNIELLQATSNPLDAQLLGEKGRAKLLKSIADSYDIQDLVPTADELDKREQEQQQQEKPPSPEDVKLQIEQIRAEVRIKDQELENANAEAQRALDLQIATMEQEGKQMDLQIAQVQNQANNESKLKEIALREQNANARFKAEARIKEQKGTGI